MEDSKTVTLCEVDGTVVARVEVPDSAQPGTIILANHSAFEISGMGRLDTNGDWVAIEKHNTGIIRCLKTTKQ